MPSILNATTTNGLVTSADNSGSLQLQTNNGTTAVTIDTAQGVKVANAIGVGNTNPTNSGAGITFPATQSASTDANTLDDYEEGTWTPSLAYGTAGTSSFSYSNRSGKYVKIGRVVYFTADVRLSAFSKGTGSGGLFMTGLPFAQENTGGYENARCTIQLYSWTYSSSPIVASVQSNTTTINIARMQSNNISVDIDDPNTASIVWITGFYFV